MEKLDILEIDRKIKETFQKEETNLESLKNKLKELELSQDNGVPWKMETEIKSLVKSLKENISDIESRRKYDFYICETIMIIERYKELLTKPITVSFYSSSSGRNNETEVEKRKLIKEYTEISKKYCSLNVVNKPKDLKQGIWCDCSGVKTDLFDMIEDTIFVCILCGKQQEQYGETISCKDVDRVNMSTKYSYDRKTHFRDCYNQYQAKQNCTIDDAVFNSIFRECVNHGIVTRDSKQDSLRSVPFMKMDKAIREEMCRKVTKNHIGMFLKELSISKHYENVNLIHYVVTGIKPDDISHLEDRLSNDFDLLLEVYDKKFKNKLTRSNFINTHYVLYQFLRRYNYPCKKEDFVMLKTAERQDFHDDITKACFQELNWNHYPMF